MSLFVTLQRYDPFRDIDLLYGNFLKIFFMYNSNEFNSAWEDWKKHKKEKTGSPYTETAEQRALSKLFLKSHGVEK